MIHHGVPDPFGKPEEGEREPIALNVGAIDRGTLVQKGQVPFVRAAAELPDVRFVLVARWLDDAVEQLRSDAGPNVELTGWVSETELQSWYRRAGVYVQASRHEGFGLAVAEAMLAGCVPVVLDVTAMPEVVGDAGVLLGSQDPAEVAEGVRRALELGGQGGRRARERILSEFPLGRRGEELLEVVRQAREGA